MNRQEKRRLKREVASKSEGQKIRERELVIKFLGLCMQVLHDNFGFGDIRLKRFGKAVDEQLDAINADYVSFDDILENLSMKEK